MVFRHPPAHRGFSQLGKRYRGKQNRPRLQFVSALRAIRPELLPRLALTVNQFADNNFLRLCFQVVHVRRLLAVTGR